MVWKMSYGGFKKIITIKIAKSKMTLLKDIWILNMDQQLIVYEISFNDWWISVMKQSTKHVISQSSRHVNQRPFIEQIYVNLNTFIRQVCMQIYLYIFQTMATHKIHFRNTGLDELTCDITFIFRFQWVLIFMFDAI